MDAISGDETLPADDVPRAPDTLPTVDRAHYDILSEHARGGLGRILRARDRRTGRLVAIKEMLHDATDAAARFQREAMITANLQHPAIVPVYELGRWPDGEPFYAMKLVAGRSLDKVIRDARTLDDRLALLPRLIDVADAMAYAHGEGVIHRDLKPANVLAGAYGETVVIDWGLAKRKGDADTGVMGTPVYMPPEQARGDQVDARADVYALGAMLYHLLSGQLPYGESGSADEILTKVRTGPPRPLAELEPGVPPDLLAIVAKAMAHDRDARYATARDLAEDLRRFQTGQLVGAHAYSAWQLLRRWLRRYRAAVTVAAVLVAALAVTAVVAVRRITAERNVAQRERADADRQRALVEARNNHLILSQARGSLATDPTAALAWLKQLPAGAPEWSAARKIASDAREHGVARWVLRGGDAIINDLAFLPDGRTLLSAGADAKIRIWDLATGQARVVDEPTPVEMLDVTPDGAHLISVGVWYANASVGRRIVVWDLPGMTPRVLPATDGQRDAAVVLTPDARSLAVMSCTGGVRIVDLSTLAARAVREPQRGPLGYCANAMAFSPDGKRLAAETATSAIDLFDVADGRLIRTFTPARDSTVLDIQFDAVGARVQVLTDVELTSWGVDQGDPRVVVPPGNAVRGFFATTDGARLALAGTDRTVRAWTVADGSSHAIGSHAANVTTLFLAPDQQRVLTASEDGTVLVSHLDGLVNRTLRGHVGEITAADLSPDGAWISTSSGDGTIRVWAFDGARRTWDTAADFVTQLLLDPGRDSLVVTAFDSGVERWTLDGARTELRPRAKYEFHPNPIARSQDGRVLAAGRSAGGIDVWTEGQAPRQLAAGTLIAGVEVAADGRRLAWVDQLGAVDLVDLPAGEPRRLAAPGLVDRAWRGLAIAGDTLVWAEAGGALGVHDLARDVTRRIPRTGGEILRLLLTADGRTAYSAGLDGEVVRWDLTSDAATLLFTQAADPDVPGRIALSPDEMHLASAGADFAVRITDLATGHGVARPGHTAEVNALAFSPDSRTVATASDDTTVRIWDVVTGEGRVTTHHEEIYALVFADDTHLVTGSENGTISVILDDVPRDEAGLRAFLADATNLVVDPAAP